MYKPKEAEDAARRHKEHAKEQGTYETTEGMLEQISIVKTVMDIDKKYTILGKALIVMRQACRQAGIEEAKYKRIYHTLDEVPEGFPVDVATKRWEAAKAAFLEALAVIEKPSK